MMSKIKGSKRYCLWQLTADQRDLKKTKKVPQRLLFNTLELRPIDITKKSNFITYDKAKENLGLYLDANPQHKDITGIGIIFTGDGLFGVDIDTIDGLEGDDFNLLDTYCEKSISGNGYHFIGYNSDLKINKRKDPYEIYTSDRYFVLTEDIVNGKDEIKEVSTENIEKFLSKYFVGVDDITDGKDKVEQIDFQGDDLERTRYLLENGSWEETGFSSKSVADYFVIINLIKKHDMTLSNEYKDFILDIFLNSKMKDEKTVSNRGNKTYLETTYNNAYKSLVEERESIFKKDEIYDLDFGTDVYFAKRFNKYVGGIFKNNVNKTRDQQLMVYNGRYWEQDLSIYDKTFSKFRKMFNRWAIRLLNNKNGDETIILESDDRKLIEKTYKDLSSQNKYEKVKKMFLVENDIKVRESDFNKDDYLINTLSGAINLKIDKEEVKGKTLLEIVNNLEIRPTQMSDMLDYVMDTEIDKNKIPVSWLKFLEEITLERDDYVDYLQKILGYTLLGSTREQVFFILYGDGGNGKSVFLEVVSEIMGNVLARTMDVNTIVDNKKTKSGSDASPDIARLKNARLVITSETDANKGLKEAFVKNLTGGEAITARPLYAEAFEFIPKFKLFMATNNRPRIVGNDRGIWRRIRLLPFELNLSREQMNFNLKQELLEESGAILWWMIKGCIKYQLEGLEEPKFLSEYKDDYQLENDNVEMFIREVLEQKETVKVNNDMHGKNFFCDPVKFIYAVYKKWSEENNYGTLSNKNFQARLELKGFHKKRVVRGFVIEYGRVKIDYRDDIYIKTDNVSDNENNTFIDNILEKDVEMRAE